MNLLHLNNERTQKWIFIYIFFYVRKKRKEERNSEIGEKQQKLVEIAFSLVFKIHSTAYLDILLWINLVIEKEENKSRKF